MLLVTGYITDHFPRPRMLPMESLYLLGLAGSEEGFVEFLMGLRDDGFNLWEPGDNELSLDEWDALATSRVRTVLTAWEIYKERTS